MRSSATMAFTLVELAVGACGSVHVPPDGEVRTVACNGQRVDILQNGNFDAIDPPWQQDPPASNLLCGEPRITPDTGAFAACLGGGADRSINTVSRDVFLPLGAVDAQLTGRICIDTDETESLDNDILMFEMLDGASVIGTLGRRTNQQGRTGCQFTNLMFEAPLTSDPVVATFRLQSRLDVGKATSFYVDTLTLTVGCR